MPLRATTTRHATDTPTTAILLCQPCRAAACRQSNTGHRVTPLPPAGANRHARTAPTPCSPPPPHIPCTAAATHCSCGPAAPLLPQHAAPTTGAPCRFTCSVRCQGCAFACSVGVQHADLQRHAPGGVTSTQAGLPLSMMTTCSGSTIALHMQCACCRTMWPRTVYSRGARGT